MNNGKRKFVLKLVSILLVVLSIEMLPYLHMISSLTIFLPPILFLFAMVVCFGGKKTAKVFLGFALVGWIFKKFIYSISSDS